MQSAPTTKDEIGRLQALFDYEVLDTEPEEAFDLLTQLASSICGTPIALVSLIDEKRQWFKSHYGLGASETPRELAFCAHAIHQDTIFEVPDSRKDERFHDNPLVVGQPHVIFYAGVPLKTEKGYNIGTLCVIDHKPSELNELQKEQLSIIAKQVVAQLELRKVIQHKDELFNKSIMLSKKIEQKGAELKAFSMRAAHDLRTPLRHLSNLAKYCVEDVAEGNYEQLLEHCQNMALQTDNMEKLIHNVFSLTRAAGSVHVEQVVNFKKVLLQVLSELESLMEENRVAVDYAINFDGDFLSEPTRLHQILHNLIANGIQYANDDKDKRFVHVIVKQVENGVEIIVQDNGVGIPDEFKDRAFEMFERINPDMGEGTGLGLPIVKKHVEKLKGSMIFTSSSEGTEFNVTIPYFSCDHVKYA